MTTVVSFANMASSPIDVSLYPLDQTKIQWSGQEISADRLTKTDTYAYAYGDPEAKTRIVVIRRDDPKKGLVHMTIRLETLQTVVVDDILVESIVATATVSCSMPGAMQDTAKALTFIGAAFSLFFNGVTTKVPNTGIIDSMNFGITTDLY